MVYEKGGKTISIRTVAAGCALENDSKILIVHRSFYGDWSLPKGQLEPGESVAKCALRETQEETGTSLRLLGFLSSTSYPTKFGEKNVYYFRGERIPNSLASRTQKALGVKRWKDCETEEARWLPPKEAGKCLTYASDRQIVSLASAPRPSFALFYANPKAVGKGEEMRFSRTLACFSPTKVFFSPSGLKLASFYCRLASCAMSPMRNMRAEGRVALICGEREFPLGKFEIGPEERGLYCLEGRDAGSASFVPWDPYPAIPKCL